MEEPVRVARARVAGPPDMRQRSWYRRCSRPAIDGAPLFLADRKTLIMITDKLHLEGLGAAVHSLGEWKDLDGGIVARAPCTLEVPSALEMAARRLVATFTAAKAGLVGGAPVPAMSFGQTVLMGYP